jgi:hypothetical protein
MPLYPEFSRFHRPVVEFRYEVQGQEFTSKTIFPDMFKIGGNLGRVAARAPLDRFKKGQQVTAYYIPESPEVACLNRQPSVLPYLFVAGSNYGGAALALLSSPARKRGSGLAAAC